MGFHRQVFFLGGFDPKSARHYHRLYRGAVAGRHGPLAGETIRPGTLNKSGGRLDHWDVEWRQGDAGSTWTTRYTVMGWDDIVRRHWHRDLRQALRDFWCVYVDGARQGIFGRLWRVSPTYGLMAFYPLAVSLGCLLGCTLLAAAMWWVWGPMGAGWALKWTAVGATLSVWLLIWRAMEGRLDSEWLLRLYGFSHAQAGGHLPDLEQRLDEWAEHLVACASETPNDQPRELLVVGHSTGCMLAASVVARALARAPWLGTLGPGLGLLTLGHCTPVLAFFDSAANFRSELARLAATPQLTWLDYAAPADWAAFYPVAPWPEPGPLRSHRASPRFHRLLSIPAYARLKRDRRALHMQYLKASELVDDYDIVELTAGPLTLSERHARLHPSLTPT